MEFIHSWLTPLPFNSFDYFIISINAIVFLLSRYVASIFIVGRSQQSISQRLWLLRTLNLFLFILYVGAVFFELKVVPKISQTGLLLLFAYVANQLISYWAIKKHGRIKQLEDKEIHSDTYTSETVSLIGGFVLLMVVVLTTLNIWGVESWLQTTSVLGGIIVMVFFTKEYWVGDMIAGLIILYNDQLQPGTVVRIKDKNILGVVLQVTLTQTVIRDLIQKHEILVPNTAIRNTTVELLSNSPKSGLSDYVDFKIGYGLEFEKVESFLTTIWEKACERENAINNEAKPRITIIDNGDHAVTWRLYFNIGNIFKLLEARNTINRVAYICSIEEGIGLNTPLTHELLKAPTPNKLSRR
ncbi:hypothetical protein A9Q81_11460 [Gammaproteobacteria bacterium 42_54_T18]|nr:hypothetical protein A9Q81_11460 [Gammaproteobacteria bacterium 42_54_T18]